MTQLVNKILLVRHGQTDWNMEGRWQGTLPVGLNSEGWEQARALAAALKGRPIAAIYSSDLPRAFETATTIGSAVGLVPHTDVRLREFNLGIFQGLTRQEIEERYPAEWHHFHADYWNYVVEQGESRRALQQRMHHVFEDVTSRGVGEEVIFVSHGGAIRMLLLALYPDDAAVRDGHIENTSVTTLERTSAGWRLVTMGDVEHLRSLSGNRPVADSL
ncbi:MAG: histidine phosphatase family protein [Anaerolineae bacterium]